MAITVKKSGTAFAKRQLSQNQPLFQEDVQENLPVTQRASGINAESTSQKVMEGRGLTIGGVSSVSSSRSSPQAERFSDSHTSKKRRLQPYILIPTRKEVSRRRGHGHRSFDHASKDKRHDNPDYGQKRNDPKSLNSGGVQTPTPRARKRGVQSVKASSLAAALGQQFEHNSAHVSGGTRAASASTNPDASPPRDKRKETEESKGKEKALSAPRSALDSVVPRRRKRKRSSSRETRESTPDELLLAPGAVGKVDDELGDHPAFDSSLEGAMVLLDERGRTKSALNGTHSVPLPSSSSRHVSDSVARDALQTGSETDVDDLLTSSHSPGSLLKTQVEVVILVPTAAFTAQEGKKGDDSRVQLHVNSAFRNTATSGPPRLPRPLSPSHVPSVPKGSRSRSRSDTEDRGIERVEAGSEDEFEDEEIRAQLDGLDSEPEPDSSHSAYHAYVQPPPFLVNETSPPSYFARERSILLHCIQQSNQNHAQPSAGQYTAPLGWEDLCRVPESVMRARGVHGVRSETPAERYVRILKSAYGAGDIWRGHGRKPPRMSGMVGQTSSEMRAAGRAKNRLQVVKSAMTIIESSSEEEPISEEERTGVLVAGATRNTATREKEPDLSDVSSADPPAPITPPDEIPVTLLANSISISDPDDALDNVESADNAPSIVIVSVNGDDGNKDDGSKEKLAGATPFVHRPPTQTPKGAPITTISPRSVVLPEFANEVRPEIGSAIRSESLYAAAPSIQEEAIGSDAEKAVGSSMFSSTTLTPFEGGAQFGTDPEPSANLTLNLKSTILPSSRNHEFTSSTSTTNSDSCNSNNSLPTNLQTNSFRASTTSSPSSSSAPIPVPGKQPVQQIRWYNTTEWKRVLRKVVSGKKPMSLEDLVRVDQTMSSIEALVRGLGGQGGSDEKRVVQSLVVNLNEYLLLLKDLPDGYIPYYDQFGLRRRAAEVLKVAYGSEFSASIPK